MSALQPTTDFSAATSGDLLAQYNATGDGGAFGELVARHEELVWGVCRRVLRHEQDAEDAFQATFLVLAKKPHEVHDGRSLASWLYGVAYRVALRANARRRRRAHLPLTETHASPLDTLEAVARRQERQLLDEELNQLPEHYRRPLVMRYLMGKSNAEVASELGVSVSAVEGRLKRGKSELRLRLARQGVGVAAALAAVEAARSNSLTAAEMPAAAGCSSEANGPAEILGGISEQADWLVQQELSTMSVSSSFVTKFAVVAVLAIIVGGLAQGLIDPVPAQSPGEAEAPIHLSLPASDPAAIETVLLAQASDSSPSPSRGKEDDTKTPSPKSSVLDYKMMNRAEERISASLEEKTAAEFIETPLSDVTNFLSQLHNIPIRLDQRALDDIGIGADAPITLQLEGVSLRSLLRLMLRDLDVDYVVANEVLMITSHEVAEQMKDTRVYELRRLEHYHPDELLEVIISAIEPQTWDDVGGSGVARALPGALVITQSQRVHEKIVDLLLQLERHTAMKP